MAEPEPPLHAAGGAHAGGPAAHRASQPLVITAVGVPPPGAEATPGNFTDFLQCHAMREAHELALWGNLDRCPTRAEALEFWRGNGYEERHLYLGRRDGQAIGLCSVTLPLRENTTTAGIDVLVAPEHRRQGLGQALLAHAEAVARAHGRTSLDAYHEVPLELVRNDSVMVPAKSGAGELPLNDLATAFAVAAGYELEQVERSSRLALPVPRELLERLEEEASLHAGDYAITGWDDSCPDHLVSSYAGLKAAMSSDVPTAGMDWEREAWDAARVREEETTMHRSGLQSVVAAALHRDTGELVAYTVLNWRPAVPESMAQQDTLVTAEHRGHRLGMLIKLVNLRRAQERWPAARSVLTWNASENQHMLAINVALGFKPAGYEGEWQKRLG